METVTLELDAYEIANKVFSQNGELDNNFTFEDVDLKTLFEMLLIIFTEGLKKFHGKEDNTVNLCELTQEDLNNMNNYLKKINIKADLKVYDYFMWNLYLEGVTKPYTEIEINNETSLRDLKYIFKRDKVFIIFFECI
tara:strand:- start:1532 stop:1945 length:414 start_codon:yes stop_codon:yes gene_type:complete